MYTIHTIDLKFQQVEETIASFLIQGKGKPVLIETGPHSTWNQLKLSLQQLGIQPKDLAAVLLTHIHFDHAGAAWEFAKAGVKIYLHPKGLHTYPTLKGFGTLRLKFMAKSKWTPYGGQWKV